MRACLCPTCGLTSKLLHAALRKRGTPREDLGRVTLAPWMMGSAAYPYLVSVRVDGREIYRVEQHLDEALADDVLADIQTALRNGGGR
jgi:hypothetical protein